MEKSVIETIETKLTTHIEDARDDMDEARKEAAKGNGKRALYHLGWAARWLLLADNLVGKLEVLETQDDD